MPAPELMPRVLTQFNSLVRLSTAQSDTVPLSFSDPYAPRSLPMPFRIRAESRQSLAGRFPVLGHLPCPDD